MRHHQIGASDRAEVVLYDLEQALLETLALLASEACDPVGRLAAALDIRRLKRVHVPACAEYGFFERLGFDLAIGHPLHSLVVNVVGPDDVWVAVRAEVKRAAAYPRLRVATVGAALLSKLAMQECVAQVVGEDEQRRGIRGGVPHGLDDAAG